MKFRILLILSNLGHFILLNFATIIHVTIHPNPKSIIINLNPIHVLYNIIYNLTFFEAQLSD
jgi:hypothetical protein